jgi:hypothetical protein
MIDMNINSEKEMYGSELFEEVPNFNAEYFVWGEELVDKKLFIYSGKLKNVPRYAEIKELLEPCGLVIVNVHRKRILRCTSAILDTESGNIYLTEANFNNTWRELKRSVELGICLARQENTLVPVQNPEDIVVLDFLVKEGRSTCIEGDVIKHRSRELTEEEKIQHGRKQSLIDNHKMLYYYSDNGKYYHDKDCETIKDILPEEFQASDIIPDDKEICPKCRRKIYFRKATYPNTKQSAVCNRIFLNNYISNQQTGYYVMELGMKFHATDLDEMQVEYEEDTWVIKGLNSKKLSLWHNNYVKTSETERYITDGFHNQNVGGKRLLPILKYIEGYSWQGHLEHEKDKQIVKDAIVETEKLCEKDAKNTKTEKKRWYQCFIDWLRKLFVNGRL